MEYSIKQLVSKYSEDLSRRDFNVELTSQVFDPSTYNEYTYRQLIKHFDRLYEHTNCLEVTEQFLKGD